MGFFSRLKKKKSSFSVTPYPMGSGSGTTHMIRAPKNDKERADLARKVEMMRYQKTPQHRIAKRTRQFSTGFFDIAGEFNGVSTSRVRTRKGKTKIIQVRDPPMFGGNYLDPVFRVSSSPRARTPRAKPGKRFDPSGLNLVSKDYDLL